MARQRKASPRFHVHLPVGTHPTVRKVSIIDRSGDQDRGWWIDFQPAGGERVRRPLGRGARGEAEAAAVAFVTRWAREQIAVGTDSLEVIAAKMVLRKRGSDGRAARYVDAIEGHLKNHIYTRLDYRRPIGTFERAELMAFRADLDTMVQAEFIERATANRVLTTLRQTFKFAEKEFAIAVPRLPENFPELPNDEVWTLLRPEVISSILGALPDEVRPLFGLVANAGLRVGAALATERSWLDLKRKLIRYPARVMKGRRNHEIELNAEALTAVETALAIAPKHSEQIFGVTYWQAYDRWQEAIAKVGVEARIHDLRHSFVSNLLDAGTPIHVVQRLAGHTDIKTTQRYAHATDAARRQAVDAVQIVVPKGTVVPLAAGSRGTNRGTKKKTPEAKTSGDLVGHLGLEPRANGLREVIERLRVGGGPRKQGDRR